ncbi:MAG: tetratricopeptide repeat protein, partial [Chloroflexi bacterium]|nr:tetratricopeptide repeat protein [Chloroflexota bacterium]
MAGPTAARHAPVMVPPDSADVGALSDGGAQQTMTGAALSDVARALVVASPLSLEVARHRASEIDRSLSELRASLRSRADDIEPAMAYRWRLLDGHEAFCRGRYGEALAIFENAVREAPRRVEGHLSAGRTLLRLGRVGEARDAFARAAALEPENRAAAAGIADCDWRAGLPVLEALPPATAAR